MALEDLGERKRHGEQSPLRLVAQALTRADRDERRSGRLQAVDASVDVRKLS
jgi:hypothetical protein